MASSSSSCHSTPPSSSQSWNHDVFLSFRGTDTRKTFVDHLYSALVQQGIYTYKDDEALPRGEAIDPSLLKAIEESRIAVIVFSENYADSSWCLDELAYIMKCKGERGQIVMPIFYHMDPSEVRKQKRKYGEAFAKHELENKKVKSWRKALTDIGNLSGWETKHIANGHEAKCIKEIVDTISNRLCATISSDNKDLIGIGVRLQDLKSKMEMESDGVLMVGIWGLGGGGKTTLASSLYDDISSRFDGCCFVENIREESSKHGLPKLQEKILSLVLKQKQMEVNRVEDGRCLIKSRLCRKKVLIVLDDVDHLDQLKVLAGSHDWFGEGTRIIITTRDNHLLNAHNVDVMYNICLLNDDEAIQLFRKHAPQHGRPIEDYKRLSQDVISYAGGLPLAVIVLGSFLCDKDKSEWTSALARLKDIPDLDIVEKLKISYDGLKPMEKELFLDIACCFRGYKKYHAMVILDACGFHPIIGVKVLIQKTLITVSESGGFHWFEMHDLIQEMGHYIVRGEDPKNPELHSRVWREEDVEKICAMDPNTENDRIEVLRHEWHFNELSHSLYYVVANMKKLRWISCFRYPATSLPREFQPMKLCYLELEWSLVEQLWEGYKHLPKLKVLDLTGSRKLIRTPDFDGLPCLERVILKDCTNLKEIHPSIGYHKMLVFLNMENCRKLEIIPPIIQMKKLETLILSDCSELHKFPEIESNMDKLEKLCLRKSGIEIIPASVGKYCQKLLLLDLSNCSHLQGIEGNFRLLNHLKEFHFNGCKQLKIPTEGLFNVECCLHVLSLSSTSFKNLHQGAVNIELLGFSHFLRRLSLTQCNLVDGDISSVLCKELPNLEALDLSGNDFSRLHSSLSQLPRLKFLDLSDCNRLVELPDLPSSIAILRACKCKSLKSLGDFPPKLKWLWKVSLSMDNTSRDNVKRLARSMLQGNAIEDYFISLYFFGTTTSRSGFEWGTFTLLLPWNWYDEFSGFLIQMNNDFEAHAITIKDVLEVSDEIDEDELEVSDEIEEHQSEVSDETDETDEDEKKERGSSMCYISFGSLKRTSWWNSTHTTISFFFEEYFDFKVELVPIRSKDDSIGRAKDATNFSEYCDEAKYEKTFEIKRDSKSSIEINWCHNNDFDWFEKI